MALNAFARLGRVELCSTVLGMGMISDLSMIQIQNFEVARRVNKFLNTLPKENLEVIS